MVLSLSSFEGLVDDHRFARKKTGRLAGQGVLIG